MNADTYIETIQLDDLTVEVHESSSERNVRLLAIVGHVQASLELTKVALGENKGMQLWISQKIKEKMKIFVWEEFAKANNIKP